MSPKFEYSVEINGQKFDIISNDLNCSPTFGQIYPKIREIVKIGANEDVNIDSHDFQVFEKSKKIKWIAHRMDQIVENNSKIYIQKKPDFSVEDKHLSSVDVKHNIRIKREDFMTPKTPKTIIKTVEQLNQNQCQILFGEPKLEEHEKDIKLFYSIVMAINIGWDLKNSDSSKLNWEKVADNLECHTDLNYMSMKQRFYYWSQFYSMNYSTFNNKLVPKHQQIFNLLKIVHILDLNQIYAKNNKSRKRIENIFKTKQMKEYFNDNLSELREKKVQSKELSPTKLIKAKDMTSEPKTSGLLIDENPHKKLQKVKTKTDCKQKSNLKMSSENNGNSSMRTKKLTAYSKYASKQVKPIAIKFSTKGQKQKQNPYKYVKTHHKIQENSRNVGNCPLKHITKEIPKIDEKNTNDSKSEEIVGLKRKIESLEEVLKCHLSNCESSSKKVKTENTIEIIELD